MTDVPAEKETHYRLPIRRPVTTAMVFLTLVVFGWKSYQELPINLMPDISYPTLTVRTEYEGAAPEDVEKLLTRPLEETLSIVSGLVEISSTSSAGLSEVVMEFAWDSDMSLAQQDVRDRLDLFEPPTEVTEKPVILRYDPTLDPVLRVAIRGSDLSDVADPAERDRQRRENLLEIRNAAEEQIKSDLEGEPGIAQVLVKGGREEEILIAVDSELLKSFGLTLAHVRNAVAQQNVNLSGGTLREGKTEYLVRTVNEYKDLDEILDTPIGATEGSTSPKKVKDVATVTRGERERETVVHINGQEAVELEIFKWGDANTVQVCNMLKDMFEFEREPTLIEKLREKARELLKKSLEPPEGVEMPEGGGQVAYMKMAQEMAAAATLRSRLPEYARLTLVSDQSRFIVASIKEVQNTAIMGGFLALVILYFFLREIRSTVIIGVAIPISVVATFIPMFMQDVTLNIMSLGGLALGVGMLVDNSIVVLESIFRCSEEGDGTVDAANRGTNEVASAVTASTLTTIAVFLPLAFVEGIAGQLFRDQALTVTFSLVASLLVALYLIPMIAAREKLALSAANEVIWVLKGYRGARRDGKGALAALGLIVPYGIHDAWRWLVETATETFNPTMEGWRTLARAARENRWFRSGIKTLVVVFGLAMVLVGVVFVVASIWKSTGVGMAAAGIALAALVSLPALALAFAVLLPVVLVVLLFSFHVALKGLALVFVTLSFFASVSLMAIVWVVGGVLRVIFWLPLKAFDLLFAGFRELYAVVLRHSLRFSPVILILVLALAAHSGMVALRLGRELIPPMKQGQFGIRMEAPPGTKLEDTEARAANIERLVLEVPEVDMVSVEVGQEKSRAETSRGENVAEFTVLLKDPEKNVERQDEIIENLRLQVARETPASDEVTFTLPSLFSFNTAIELQIRGDELDRLKEIGEQARDAMEQVPGLRDVELSMKTGYPEIIIELDRDLCAANNIDLEQLAQRLRIEIQGEDSTEFDEHGTKIPIVVRTDQRGLQSLQDLKSMSVREGTPPLPLSVVAPGIEVRDGPSQIQRVDQRRTAMITADIKDVDLWTASEMVMQAIAPIAKPDDYQYVLGGQRRELQTSLQSLQFALLLAVFLVYVVMACQFESIGQPAIVMGAVPLAFIGVIYVLYWLAIDLSIVVYIGGIILAGIVVNDAIVLVDYVNQLRARGMSKREAVIEAGKVRLRPILMTTLTTVLGLLPMAVWAGEGAEIRRPMAITVMAGLSSATVLTLIIIPMIYDLFVFEKRKKA